MSFIPSHQFGIRNNLDQVHRMTDVTEKPLEKNQVFNKVWHESCQLDYYQISE